MNKIKEVFLYIYIYEPARSSPIHPIARLSGSEWLRRSTAKILLALLYFQIMSDQFHSKLTLFCNYKSLNLTKPGTYVKGYTNYNTFSNLRVLALKWTQECEKIQISNQVIMHISNEYSKLCFKQHTFSLGTIFIPKMK